MQATTLEDAKRNLPQLVEQVLADTEPQIVVTDQGGQVVVMPLDEFNSWKERVYLALRASRANETKLHEALAAIPDSEPADRDKL